jgi:hypothetical protein
LCQRLMDLKRTLSPRMTASRALRSTETVWHNKSEAKQRPLERMVTTQ